MRKLVGDPFAEGSRRLSFYPSSVNENSTEILHKIKLNEKITMSSVISMFLGIIIRMYWEEEQPHQTAHIYAEYQEHNAVFAIPNGEILEGGFPRRQRNFVRAWISLHEDELIANWELAMQEEQLFKIDPLK